MNDLYLLAINLTKRCNLACQHCYLDATTLKCGDANELSSEEVCKTLDEVASRSNETMVVLTGGEPLLRNDLEAMIDHGAKKGLAMVVGSNGTLLTEKRVNSLRLAGLMGIGISLDSLNEKSHDDFRAVPGSWRRTMEGIDNCLAGDLSFQIHFTVTEKNADELTAVIEFCKLKKARVLNVFFLICTGRGDTVTDISSASYERVIAELIKAQADNPELIIRPRCAPHYKRIAHQLQPDAPINQISGNEGDGCIAATHYCRIDPQGQVTPCPYIEDGVGSIREQSFLSIWDNAELLNQMRSPSLKGKCGDCEYSKLCGGCRARPRAAGRSLMDEDPWCEYQPQGGEQIVPLNLATTDLIWSQEAQKRVERIPGFIRKVVRKKVEAYVMERGEKIILTEHLSEMTARRFGSKRLKHPNHGAK